MQCDRCDNSATVHLIEIKSGNKVEKHLCEQHAVEEGVSASVTSAPISQLLEKFGSKESGKAETSTELHCDYCGLTYDEFRRSGILGCPHCYTAFESALEPLLQQAQEGEVQHMGKVPRHAGATEVRQQRLLQLRRELEEAVSAEDYERAAQLRDEVRQLEAEKT